MNKEKIIQGMSINNYSKTGNMMMKPYLSYSPFPKSIDFNVSSNNVSTQLKNIWEIPAHLKCPVVGLCLSVGDSRKILKNSGYRVKKLNIFNLHTQIMEHLNDKNQVSLKVESYFRKKYRKSIMNFSQISEEEFMKNWHERIDTGELADLFYISAVRPDLSDASSIEIYGKIHMMGHANTKEIMKLKKSLAFQKELNFNAQIQLSKEKVKYKHIKKESSNLQSELTGAYKRITQLSSVCTCLRKQQDSSVRVKENQILNKTIQKLERENKKLNKELLREEREKKKLQIEVFELGSANQQLAEETKGMIRQFAELSECHKQRCNDTCPDFHICSKRILIVGGITRIKHLYRDLVESHGGQFDYHDGYMKNARQKIEAQVRRSDIVICPVNCNSHVACERVKHLCRKYDKPVKMLPNSSLSAISSVLYNSN